MFFLLKAGESRRVTIGFSSKLRASATDSSHVPDNFDGKFINAAKDDSSSVDNEFIITNENTFEVKVTIE